MSTLIKKFVWVLYLIKNDFYTVEIKILFFNLLKYKKRIH